MKKRIYQPPQTVMQHCALSHMIAKSPHLNVTGGIGRKADGAERGFTPGAGEIDKHDGYQTGYIGWGGESDSTDVVGVKKHHSLWDEEW